MKPKYHKTLKSMDNNQYNPPPTPKKNPKNRPKINRDDITAKKKLNFD